MSNTANYVAKFEVDSRGNTDWEVHQAVTISDQSRRAAGGAGCVPFKASGYAASLGVAQDAARAVIELYEEAHGHDRTGPPPAAEEGRPGKTIFKHRVPISCDFSIDMTEGARVLGVQLEGGDPQVWILEDFIGPMESRGFRTFATGDRTPEDIGAFVGTIQLNGGEFVFHLFEAPPA